MSDWLKIPVEDLPREIPAAQRELLGITERELQVLQLLCLGKSNKEIGRAINCSPRTVESHRTHIRLRTRCENVLQLAIFADRMFRQESS